MTRNPRSDENLRRGGLLGTSQAGRHAREARARYEADDEQAAAAAGSDLGAALEDVATTLARHLIKLQRRSERSGKEPSRALIDATREFRVTLEAVERARASRGMDEEAKLFADKIEQGIRQANLGQDLRLLRPLAERPASPDAPA
jgi:hypothetical protein